MSSEYNTAGSIELNHPYDIGSIALSEQDIIEYAKANDPLDFHIDIKAAEKSIFKGLVASGSQIFNVLHKNGWIPKFGHSVICGLEVNNWKFLRPVYANQLIKGIVTPVFIKDNKDKGHAIIVWHYELTDTNGHLVQALDVTVLHKL